MAKSVFRRIKESLPHTNQKMSDFEKAKEVLFSVKNKSQLISAVKFINNFNKKHGISRKSPEFIYFDRMIKIMRKKIHSNNLKISEGNKKTKINLKNKIKESLKDFQWVKDIQPNPFLFDGKEQWLDLTNINKNDRIKIVNYLQKVLPHITEDDKDGLIEVIRSLDYKGIIIHCGSEGFDYKPTEYSLCTTLRGYKDDYVGQESKIPHIYLDGEEILSYIELLNGEAGLDESLEWFEKDNYFDEKDKNFETDPSWKNDDDWEPNPERSYWRQGDIGGSTGGGMNESDFDWLKDIEEHANYKGQPQGIVLIRNHQEIDRFCDIIDEYNDEVVDNARDWLHDGLEDRKDEIESMSAEDNYDYGEALLTVSFFVVKRRPGKLTLGYWPYDVTEDEWAIKHWLDGNYTFNRDYEVYNSLNQVERIFKNYQNPELD